MMILAESDSVGAIVGADNDASTSAISMAHHSHQHLKMYKPARVLSQFVFNHRKRRNRTLLGEFVDVTAFDKNNKNIMAIGRLDEDSEGLLLLTTDGKVSEIVRRKTTEKEYWVQVSGLITENALERLRGGVQICIPSPPPSSSSSLSSSFVEHGCDSSNRSIERGTGRIIYTTLPCKAAKLETVMVECTMQQSGTLADGGDLTSDSHQRHSNHNISTKRNKRKFQGTCNTCGNTGHKALDCDQNPIIIDRCEQPVRGPSIVALPPGISPSSRLTIRDNASSSICRHGPSSWISITITEGKFRQVRKMTAAVGYPTLRLVRVRIGSITLDGMKEGEVRILRQSEIDGIVM